MLQKPDTGIIVNISKIGNHLASFLEGLVTSNETIKFDKIIISLNTRKSCEQMC